MKQTPLSIVWPCRLSVEEYAAAGKQVEVPRQDCPDCERPLNWWAGYERPIRSGRGYRIWIRRGRCPPCEKTHALLPDFVHERRYDAVDVIGPTLELGISGRGMQKVAEEMGVPFRTARGWRRPHRAGASALLQRFAELALKLGVGLGEPGTDIERAALVALATVWTRVQERLPGLVARFWRFWNAVCGGRALGTNATSPLARTG